jgi:hypothetical protein
LVKSDSLIVGNLRSPKKMLTTYPQKKEILPAKKKKMLTTSKWCAYIKFFFSAPLTEKNMIKKSTKQYDVI